MDSKFARLRIAALVGIACTFSTAFADDLNRTITLSWSSPSENVDGSPLEDLLGYYLYAGPTPETLAPVYFTLESNMVFGTGDAPLYFAVTTVNANGIESVLSAVVSLPARGPQ
jgi:hypothetical protein